MVCTNCGKTLKPNKKFCPNCGTPVAAIQCKVCFAFNELTDNFCGDCGTRLAELLAVTGSLELQAAIIPVVTTIRKIRDTSRDNERRFVTVLFADLVGFTNFSTQRDPEEVSLLVRHMVEIFGPEITSRGGVVDKYEGDAVLARYGAPVAHEDDALQAVRTALALHRRIVELNDKHKRPDGEPFRLRIGLNTGQVIAGTIDRDGRDYTILGDAVNTSQRFQTAAQPGETVVGELTYRLTRSVFEFEALGPLALKGKPKPALAYKLVGLKIEAGDGRGLIFNADAGPRSGESPFVGCTEELILLDQAYQRAHSGQGQLVLISGEKGIGKSRLARHFLHSHQQERLVVGRAFSFSHETPHALLANLLLHLLGQHPSETLVHPQETRNRLTELGQKAGLIDGYEDALELALLADALGLSDDDKLLANYSQGQRGHTLQRTVKELLCGLSLTERETQPLVVLLEDMHWADRPSGEAIELLAESLADFPILVIVNSRPEWQPPANWQNLAYYQRLELGALDTEERQSLLNYVLRKLDFSMPPHLQSEVIEATGGNPFFLEEMVMALKEAALQAVPDEHGKLNLQVPASLHELLLARIDRLDPSSRRILQIGAVLGRRFPERLLRLVASRVLEAHSNHLEQGLLHLTGQEVLLENRLAQELEFFFKHGLLQEVAYGIMLTERRQELHEMVGAALEELYSGREDEVLGLLAYHYSQSNNIEKAVQYLIRAGDRAFTYDAHHDAQRYFTLAATFATDAASRASLEARLANFVT